MKLYRIWGIFLRYYYNFLHSYDRLADAFFWPLVDLTLWGLTSRFVAGNATSSNLLILALLGGIVLWIFPWRSQYEITVNLLEDLWNRNLVNMFATPVQFSEWVFTLMLIGVFKSLISFIFAASVAYFLYAANLFTLGWVLLPWAGLLIMFGWVFGLFISGIIMRYGSKVQTLAWTSIYIVAPFAAVYYPVSTLPTWAQAVAHWVPASYVFEAFRAAVMGRSLPISDLLFPTLLCGFYLAFALFLLFRSYRHILTRGLISVE